MNIPISHVELTPLPTNTFKVLSLDGGGIRGAFTAAVLDVIEERTKRPAFESFDLFAGTSTGGIIAAGLASGEKASRIVQFYRNHGPRIFARPARKFSWKSRFAKRACEKRLKGLGIDYDWLFTSKYDAEALQSALETIFCDNKLETITASRLVIPSVDLTKGQTVVFKTPHLPRLDRDRHFKLVDILLATSAAPTYFPVATIGKGSRYVDGGLWANNPTIVGLAEAVKILQVGPKASEGANLGTAFQNIEVLSIGTGTLKAFMQPSSGADGLAWWIAGRLVELMFLAQSQGIHFQSQYLLGDNYARIDFDIPDVSWKLDNVLVIDELIHLGREAAKSNLELIDRFCSPRSELSFQRFGAA